MIATNDGGASKQGPPGSMQVQVAFALGWNVAQLFHSNVPGSNRPPAELPAKLPGMSDLDGVTRARGLLLEIVSGLRRVGAFGDQPLGAPDVAPVATLLDAETRDPDQLRRRLLALHRELLTVLTAADFRLGKAYGLGRALAETVLLPSGDQDAVSEAFGPYRTAKLQEWLSDLKSFLPDHATEAVRGSLDDWVEWARHPTVGVWSESGRRVLSDRPVSWADNEDRARVARALHRQGQVWRSLLSGEKLGVDMLSTSDYVRAATQLANRLGSVVWRFLRNFKTWLITIFATIIAILVAVAVARIGSAVAAAFAVLAGGVGITWKGVGGTLGKAVARVERPLWDAELDTSIALATTRLPQEVKHDRGQAK